MTSSDDKSMDPPGGRDPRDDEVDEEEVEEIPADAIEFVGHATSGEEDRSGTGGGDSGTGRDGAPDDASFRIDSAGEGPEAGDGAGEGEVLDVDEHDDLIIEAESAEESGLGEEDFARARRGEAESGEREEAGGDYDVGPTIVSDEIPPADDENAARTVSSSTEGPDAPGRSAESGTGSGSAHDASDPEFADRVDSSPGGESRARTGASASRSLSDVADEMAASERDGDLDGRAGPPDDSTVVDEGTPPEALPTPATDTEETVDVHGEAALDVDDAVERDDFELEEYDPTIINDEGFAVDDEPMPEAPAGGVAAPATIGDDSEQTNPEIPEPVDPGASAEVRGGVDDSRPGPMEALDGAGPEETTSSSGDPLEDSALLRLTVREGPAAGHSFTVDELPCIVGRSTEADVTVPDDAVSRRHFEIRRERDGSPTLRDLESANGTQLNESPAADSALDDGDRIEAGKSTFQVTLFGVEHSSTPDENRIDEPKLDRAPPFEPPESTRAEASRSAPLGRWLNRIVAGTATLVALLSALLAYLWFAGPEPPTEAERTQRNAAREAYLSGVEAMRSEKWDRAAEKFERAERLNPDLPELGGRLERVEMEREARASLEEARRAAEEGRRERALELADSVPDESTYAREADNFTRRLRRERRIADRLRRAREELERDDPRRALDPVEDVLAIAPTHPRALALRSEILRGVEGEADDKRDSAPTKIGNVRPEGRLADPEQTESADSTGHSERESGGGRGSGHSSWLLETAGEDEPNTGSEGGTGPAGEIDFQRGYALYNQNRLDEAIEHFEEASRRSKGAVAERAGRLARKIEAFATTYRAGRERLSSEDWSGAAQKLRRALEIDRSVADARYFEDDIESRLARAEAKMGEAELREDRYGAAYERLRKARDLDSSRDAVRELERSLENRADSMYIRARAKRKTDPERAAEICRTITSMLPEGHDLHERARTLLDEI